MSTLLLAADWLAQVPNPPARELPGELGNRIDTVLGYGKTICYALAFGGLLAVAGMLFIGLRGRSDTAKNALGHLPMVILGVVITGGAGGIIQAFQ
ncbi:hypothetical protein SAMN05421776_11326 [Nocardia farcinica]|uniref:TrbC/VIRB2 family n=1 Tax=Nocardia farcinica TaxID=37329 RepID=A0A0H5P9T7_NOCFR|nr:MULTISPECIES: hypothetical protein [Nocardia]AXK89968.1 hypothetical protein DXT66_29700 [Nocardia farcinica]PFW99372.1 hypothetical protein CJ469_05292 [Nocardia farcinica]PFX06783.1 hypothetical protein CJ468_04183 [Nocardia farcinica]CRY84600.1 Uncharacterised protein [Nocardia farcinica]SIT32506.1 hypothetical protein SAMN05421776_11326 [Nocardia farcinica]